MLYIIRHGVTEWNQQMKLQGRTDVPLSDEGRDMAKKASQKYRDIHFDICYSSPLSRAKETAEILMAERNIPILTDDRLMEMGFGCMEGVENSMAWKNNPDNPMYDLFNTPEKYIPVEHGESLDALFERTGNFLDEVINPLLKQGKDILIVGHGAMNSSIITQVRKLSRKDLWSCRFRNCELICLSNPIRIL